MRFIIFLVLIAAYCATTSAQLHDQKVIDSLVKQLAKLAPDSSKVLLLNTLSDAYFLNSQTKESQNYSNEALQLALKLKYPKGIADAYCNIANTSIIGGDNTELLNYTLKALRIYQEIDNEKGLARCYGKIGGFYGEHKQYKEALPYFSSAILLYRKMNMKIQLANCLNNVGRVYDNLHEYTKAKESYLNALKIYDELKNSDLLKATYYNIGKVFEGQHDLKNAISYYTFSLKMCKDKCDSEGIEVNYRALAGVYIKLKNNSIAEDYANQSLKIARKINDGEGISDTKNALSKIYSATGRYKKALTYYKEFIDSRDSFNNSKDAKKIVEIEMRNEFEKKVAIARNEEEKRKIAASEKIKQEKLKLTTAIIVIVLLLIIAMLAIFAFISKRKDNQSISNEKKISEDLLLNILPEEIAKELKAKGSAEAKMIDEVTVLFTDFKGFTQLSEKLTAKALVAEINECFSAFDYIMEKYGVEKIKTIGDSYMAAGGLPTANKTHPEDVVNAAIEIQQYMAAHKAKKEAAGELYFEIRIGINTGPVVAGIVGVKKFQYDIWGDTVNTASRMESSGEVGKVNISETTYELVKDKFQSEYRGEIQAKNKGMMKMYFVR